MTLQLHRNLLRQSRGGSACDVCRTFSSSAPFLSGHSKWSTIKHDKAKNDKAKSKERQMMSKEIASATQCKYIVRMHHCFMLTFVSIKYGAPIQSTTLV